MKSYRIGSKLFSTLTITALAAVVVLSGCKTSSCCAQVKTPKHVLVVTTTVGFRHSSIETAEKIIADLGQQSGAFNVDYARLTPNAPEFKGADGKTDKTKYESAVKAVLAEKMSATALQQYDAVIFANTTGDIPLPDPQAFVDWVKAGHGFVGVHSATDTFPGFAPYNEMIGGHFKTHGAQVSVDIINQDKECAACRHLPATWTVFDEIYQLKDFDRTKVHGLLTLDKHPNDKTPGDYPIAWAKEFGQGRVFYTSLGHREDVWEPNSPAQKGGLKNTPEVALAYQQHLLGGIKWTLGLEKCDAKPQSLKP
ncbi:MAG: ThuA domain-containing protein [Verrucomicrobiota bacterium]